MKTGRIKTLASVLLILCIGLTAQAQEYISPTNPAQTGRSPGVKVKLLSTKAGEIKFGRFMPFRIRTCNC